MKIKCFKKLIALLFLVTFIAGCGSEPQAPNQTQPTQAINTSTTGSYVASSNSDKFHRPDCKWTYKIKPANKLIFATRDDAIKQGLHPCGTCKP